MIPRIIQNDMQNFIAAIFPPEPLEKSQKAHPILLDGEYPDQRIPFHIVSTKHIAHTPCATIGGAVTVHVTGPSIVFTMMGLKIQRAKFVDANATSIFGTLAVKSANPPVFGPELRIIGVLPRLAMTPVNPVLPQQLTKPFQGYRRKNLLRNQILSKFL